ncbi:DUF4336 domain-containing protein [Allosphingosinicella deserti]|nr:DUF4336 domain-containing protein [Sphingomonas deserti]
MSLDTGKAADAGDDRGRPGTDRPGAPGATPILIGAGLGLAAGILLGLRAADGVGGGAGKAEEATYPPLDVPKPLAADLWIVDSGPMHIAGLTLPIRMTIVRLQGGDLLIHSPTRFTPDLGRQIDALGTVRHLIAPNIAHWTFLSEWQQAYPATTTWGAPGLRDRRQVRVSAVTIDRELGDEAPPAWRDEIDQGIVSGAGGFRETYFFHKASRTLILVDLIESVEPARLPPLTRFAMRLSGATRDSTAFHVRSLLLLDRQQARQAVTRMLALQPARVLFAHGRWFADRGAERLNRAFAWLL